MTTPDFKNTFVRRKYGYSTAVDSGEDFVVLWLDQIIGRGRDCEACSKVMATHFQNCLPKPAVSPTISVHRVVVRWRDFYVRCDFQSRDGWQFYSEDPKAPPHDEWIDEFEQDISKNPVLNSFMANILEGRS